MFMRPGTAEPYGSPSVAALPLELGGELTGGGLLVICGVGVGSSTGIFTFGLLSPEALPERERGVCLELLERECGALK